MVNERDILNGVLKYIEQESLPADTSVKLKCLETDPNKSKFIIEVESPKTPQLFPGKSLQRVESFSSISADENDELGCHKLINPKRSNRELRERTHKWEHLLVNNPNEHLRNYEEQVLTKQNVQKVKSRKSIQRKNFRRSSQPRQKQLFTANQFVFIDKITPKTQISVGARVIRAMRTNLKDANLQIRGLVALRRLLEKGHKEVALAGMGAGLIAINAIRHHWKDVAVVEPAIGLIANLCANDRIAETLMKSGAAQAVLTSLVNFMNDAYIVEEAFIAFSNLHHGDLKRRKFLLEIEAPRAIKEAMVRHMDSPPILIEGFIAVTYLQRTWYDDEVPSIEKLAANKKAHQGRRGKRHWQDFFELGVHEIILKALKTFKEDKELQVQGMYALSFVISGISERKKLLAKETQLFVHLSNTFGRFRDDAQIAEAVFALLFQLCRLHICCKTVIEYELHTDILKAMRKFLEVRHELLQLIGLKLLYALCNRDKRVSRAIKGCGGIHAAIRARTLFPNNLSLVETGDRLAMLIARGGRI